MRKISIKDLEILEVISDVLKSGGVVMHPTETCYGFAVDIFNEKALKKLYELKKMSLGKPVSILCADLEMAKEYGEFSEKALELALKYWPGPLSLVVKRTDKLPKFLNQGEEFVSIRVSDNDFCRKMTAGFGGPVTTTSANVSGQPQLYEVELKQFENDVEKIDLGVDGGMIKENKPSTIVKVVGNEVIILRQGELILE